MIHAFHFTDALIESARSKRSSVVVGLDTDPRRLPRWLTDGKQSGQAEAQVQFNRAVIDAVEAVVPAVKVQIAYYELLGPAGLDAYRRTIHYAHEKGLVVIGDIKRGDIGSTADAYAQAHLVGDDSVDAVTVNPRPEHDPQVGRCREASGILRTNQWAPHVQAGRVANRTSTD